jgi:hypothetical protein
MFFIFHLNSFYWGQSNVEFDKLLHTWVTHSSHTEVSTILESSLCLSQNILPKNHPHLIRFFWSWINFVLSRTFYTWNYMVGTLWCLFPFCQHNVLGIDLCCCPDLSPVAFCCWIEFCCLDLLQFICCPFTCWEIFVCHQAWLLQEKTVRSTSMQVFICEHMCSFLHLGVELRVVERV